MVGHQDLDSSMHSIVTCDIFMEDVPSGEATRMNYGHGFCNNCSTEHFMVKINKGQSRRIRCTKYDYLLLDVLPLKDVFGPFDKGRERSKVVTTNSLFYDDDDMVTFMTDEDTTIDKVVFGDGSTDLDQDLEISILSEKLTIY